LKDIAKRAPAASERALRSSVSQLDDADEILIPADLANSHVLADISTAITDDDRALGTLIHVQRGPSTRWIVAQKDVKQAIPRKEAAIAEARNLPTSSSAPTPTSGLEACAGQATPTQDFVKVSYPGLTGATGGISFVANGTTQATTFALGSTGIGFATG